MMKTLFILIAMICIAVVAMATGETTPETPGGVWNFLMANWAELLIAFMAFVKVVVRLTPTLKDDRVFGYLDDLIAFFVPNLKAKK